MVLLEDSVCLISLGNCCSHHSKKDDKADEDSDSEEEEEDEEEVDDAANEKEELDIDEQIANVQEVEKKELKK